MKNNNTSSVRTGKLKRWAETHTMILSVLIAILVTALFVALTSNIGTGLGTGLFG